MHTRSLTALGVALALALGAPGIATAQAAHEHDAAALEIVLNEGAKWQGDQNMIAGMSAIRDVMAVNLEAVHAGTLSAEAAGEMATEVQKQLDFMISNCVLEPAVDEQFHVVLGRVMDGVSALEDGQGEAGAVTIVEAINAYGEHFEHPGWQALN